MATIREMIEVMEAHERGEPIEVCAIKLNHWTLVSWPQWDWARCKYRVAEIPDSIDWSHVHPDFKYMARDVAGTCLLSSNLPEKDVGQGTYIFRGRIARADSFASYKKGTIPWTKSLVKRPS